MAIRHAISSHDLLEQGIICEEIDEKEDEGGQELEQEGGLYHRSTTVFTFPLIALQFSLTANPQAVAKPFPWRLPEAAKR